MSASEDCRARFSYRADPLGSHDAGAPTVLIDLEGTDPDEHILKLIRTHGRFYESDLLEHLLLHGPQGGVYVDIGANIGNHAVFFGRFLADQVIAIEPSPDLLPILKRNLVANGIAQWIALPVALGAGPGFGRLLRRAECDGNAGAQHVVPAGPDSGGNLVELRTLDSVLWQLGSEVAAEVRLVKMDIEGGELDALHGAARLLAEQGPDLVVEAARDAEHAAVAAFLSTFDYREVGRFCNTPTYHFRNPTRPFPRCVGSTGRS